MNIVLLQAHLSEEEVQCLLTEFPQFLFLATTDVGYKNLGKEEWDRVEVLFGNRLSPTDLEKAVQLRWIHSPLPSLSALCLNELEKHGHILVTRTQEENIFQIGEYIMGGVLAFAKNLFHWERAMRTPSMLWDSKWRESMWTLKDRVFLQIGLGRVGSEIARRAKEMEMCVWGVTEHRTFHQYCEKVFSNEELHDALPAADVVSIALPRGKQTVRWFKRRELKLMKEDSILAIFGAKHIIDEHALAEVAGTGGKFRGILLDAFYQMPIASGSPLWGIPNIIITPEVAPRPKASETEAFRYFRYNLRQYIHGNLTDMRNIVGTKQSFLT